MSEEQAFEVEMVIYSETTPPKELVAIIDRLRGTLGHYTKENASLTQRLNALVGNDALAAQAKQAAAVLSITEVQAAHFIFIEFEEYIKALPKEGFKDNEGIVVASRVADTHGFTRSVAVSALRKLESAGMLRAQSMGMKGSYIRINNSFILQAIHNRQEGLPPNLPAAGQLS